MTRFRNLAGQRFGRLMAIDHVKPKRAGDHTTWYCKCDCGNGAMVQSSRLISGHTQSCGCAKIKHGHGGGRGRGPSATYKSWQAMIARCTYASNLAHAHYSKHGITVCDRWRTFENFLADMGERPPGTTLDRWPDNRGNYEPGNCRWATKIEQANNRSTNHRFTYRGKEYTLIELARATGQTKEILRARLIRSNRWSVEDAVQTPVLGPTEKRKPRP